MLPLEDRELLTQTMVGLNVDADTIQSLMDSFDIAAEDLEANPIPAVPSTTFGESYTGGYRLATNVDMAHVAVREELAKIIAGLRQMGESVQLFSEDVQNTTEQTTATMNLYNAGVSCVAAPDFGTDQCTIPTDEG
ncbi:hypothetical protein SAMN04489844_2426 [Nocardioides exalbidus]|uniref:Uncharacterized protein n=1 Tax=Nocardioides exalbidus TaxID=402596 RepID=A0A1H4T3Z3_9ACTN|nr:hypothetical protein [Nocardioides exalbidus]SEC50884.1 hypothetical protein SAMN04489844_2426 [Nocardioides exalbidus]